MLQIPCPKCTKYQPPYLDPKTEKVYCSACNQEIPGTHFIKVQLKALKQYKEVNKTSFSVKCDKCSNEDRPALINNQIYCVSCKKEIGNLTEVFKEMLRVNLGKADKDV
jgi:hypothetical protein